jgi:hypothetical protein
MELFMGEMPKWLMDKMSDESFKEYTIGSMADDAFQHGAMSCYQEMQKKLDIAVEALEFYADTESYEYLAATSHPECMGFVGIINEVEAGEKARESLEKIRGEK